MGRAGFGWGSFLLFPVLHVCATAIGRGVLKGVLLAMSILQSASGGVLCATGICRGVLNGVPLAMSILQSASGGVLCAIVSHEVDGQNQTQTCYPKCLFQQAKCAKISRGNRV